MHITDVDFIKTDSSLNKSGDIFWRFTQNKYASAGSDSNLLIVFYVQIMPDDLVMQLHRF